MILVDNQQKKYVASKCPRPKIGTTSFGRLWEAWERQIDGKKVSFYLEVARGSSFYFQFDGVWFRLPFFAGFRKPEINDPFEVREFFTNKQTA